MQKNVFFFSHCFISLSFINSLNVWKRVETSSTDQSVALGTFHFCRSCSLPIDLSSLGPRLALWYLSKPRNRAPSSSSVLLMHQIRFRIWLQTDEPVAVNILPYSLVPLVLLSVSPLDNPSDLVTFLWSPSPASHLSSKTKIVGAIGAAQLNRGINFYNCLGKEPKCINLSF